MTLPVKHPFADRPQTIQSVDEKGRPTYVVKARALTPVRAKCADALTFCGTLAAVAGVLSGVGASGSPDDWLWVGGFLGPLASAPLQRLGLGRLLQKQREIALTADTFSFKTLTGWKHYNRHLEHSFALYRHDQAEEEMILQDLRVRKAAAKGSIIKAERYYADSYHLVFEYLGQRIDVMDIYRKKDAQRILNRLSACDAVVNAGLGQGKGTALSPEDDWTEGPGALPQE
jgi:hypothetical protein